MQQGVFEPGIHFTVSEMHGSGIFRFKEFQNKKVMIYNTFPFVEMHYARGAFFRPRGTASSSPEY